MFVAVRDECNVGLHIHESASPTSPIVASTTNAVPPRVVKLGRKLFVSVINVTGQFTPGHEYGYDVTIVVDGDEHHLADLNDERRRRRRQRCSTVPSRSATPPICFPR